MSVAGVFVPRSDHSSRWLLIASLALNLFFIGVGGALVWQSLGSNAGVSQSANDHSIASHIEHIAAILPRDDADKLRTAYRANAGDIDGAQAAYRRMENDVRTAIAARPFNVEAVRTAMVRMRAARQAYDQRVQGFFADLLPALSQAGRQKLATWHGSRGSSEQAKSVGH